MAEVVELNENYWGLKCGKEMVVIVQIDETPVEEINYTAYESV